MKNTHKQYHSVGTVPKSKTNRRKRQKWNPKTHRHGRTLSWLVSGTKKWRGL